MNKQSEKAITSEDFGASPFAAELQALREKQARDNPAPKPVAKPKGPIGHGNPFKRNILEVVEAPDLKARGLMIGWINLNEVEEYTQKGARLATRKECSLVGNPIGHTKGGEGDGMVRRGNSVAIVQPLAWLTDRIQYESELAQAQLGAAARVPGTTGNAGFFGAQPLRPMAEEEPREGDIDSVEASLAAAEAANE